VSYNAADLRSECRRHGVTVMGFESPVDLAHRLLLVLPCFEMRQNLQGHPIEFRRLHAGEWVLTIDTYRAQGGFIHCVTALARRCEPKPKAQQVCTA
jgi:hypothetical protein